MNIQHQYFTNIVYLLCLEYFYGAQEFPMFHCDTCSRMYKYRENLCRHKRLECGIEPKYHCHLCTYKAKQKCTLEKHLRRLHPDYMSNVACNVATLSNEQTPVVPLKP